MELPRWELDSVFPGIASTELDGAVQAIVDGIAALGRLVDERDVRAGVRVPAGEAAATFEAIAAQLNEVLERATLVGTYLTCLIEGDSRDTAAQARQSELRQHYVELEKVSTRLTAWI